MKRLMFIVLACLLVLGMASISYAGNGNAWGPPSWKGGAGGGQCVTTATHYCPLKIESVVNQGL